MATKYQGYGVRAELQKSISSIEKQLNPSGIDADPAVVGSIQSRELLRRQVDLKKKRLTEMTPPEIKPEERKSFEARKRLLETALREGRPGTEIPPIPSEQQMKSNPDYSTEQHLRHERIWHNHTVDKDGNVVPARGGYGAIFELKDMLYREYRDSEEMANIAGSIEYLRSGAAQPLAYMHRPVSFPAGPSTQEKYDAAFPDHIPTQQEVQAGHYTEQQRQERLAAQDAERCKAVTAKGQRCSGKALPGKNYCMINTHREQFEKPPIAPAPEPSLEATA